MGRFTSNIRNWIAGRPQHKTASQLGTDAYFIRLKRTWWKFWKEDVFIHFDGKVDSDLIAYRPKQGKIGACIFKLDNAIELIKESGASNLELVKIERVIKQQNG